MTTLHELFVDELRDIYNAEHQMAKALPRLAQKASSPQLRATLMAHLEETKMQIERLEIIGMDLGIRMSGKNCTAMEGLIEEGEDFLEEEGESAVIDAGLIGVAQRAEHYEMAAYGTVRAMAEELGEPKFVMLLQDTLDEERKADRKLSEVSEGGILAAAHVAGAGNGDGDTLAR